VIVLSEFLRDLERSKYEVFLQKTIRQRPEHLASALKRFPHAYGFIFVHVAKFESVPAHFMTIKRSIELSGRRIDGQIAGTYALTLHGKASCGNPEQVRYMAGCKLIVSVEKGIQVKEVKCRVPPFKWLLQTARVYDLSGEPFVELEPKRKKPEDCGCYSAF
jgi:hypothetical protein